MSEKIPSIYLDACPIIDMAQEKAGVTLAPGIPQSVWLCTEALRASRDKKARVFTSFLSIAECTSVAEGVTSPPDDVKRFFDMLLLSGKSGIELVSITQAIAIRARSLRWVSGVNLKGADTVHVATAMAMKCDELWTRDGRIYKNREKISQLGLNVVQPDASAVLPDQYRGLRLIL